MNIRTAKQDYVQSAWATTVPDLLVFYSILFYCSVSILKTLTKT